ncbi:phosphotransferase [Streptomyces sp. NPDC059897]|uniref:phosphotransferase n=1 Tax=Streptomyces sp. NPDC059897 TaxID=3346994 RepID=UPI003649D30B
MPDVVAGVGVADVWRRVVERAQRSGERTSGHHNLNHVVRLTDEEALALERPLGSKVMVRQRMTGVAPVVIRTWGDEQGVLEALRGSGRPVPQCLDRFEGGAVHSYLEGAPLSSICRNGDRVDPQLIQAFAELLADMARVPEVSLPARPDYWPKDGDSRGFLRMLLTQAEEQIRRPNWPEFGGLFVALGVPENTLRLYQHWAPRMTPRPFHLLHGDLHRGNVIVTHDGEPLLLWVDWELATYGDPLHDLAVHLVRMDYPRDQRNEVVELWHKAMWSVRPEAVEGLDSDLRHYIDFEHAQSVYPDVIRAAGSLEERFSQSDLERAAAEVHRALKVASRPLRLRNVLTSSAIEPLLYRWRVARGGRHRGKLFSAAIHWEPDTRLPLLDDFPPEHVEEALWAEGVAPASHVFKGTSHLGTFVEVRGFGRVMVRRKVADAVNPIEPRFLNEHTVLRAIEESGAKVSISRVLALGTSDLEDQFTIQSYAGHHRARGGPQHPEHGLLPGEVIDLVDQLCQLAEADIKVEPQDMGELSFYPWLCHQLHLMVRELAPPAKDLAARLGLPDEDELEARLLRHDVQPRADGLLHGDLNPWNLVRREGRTGLTLIDWEMAMVGDPLYDLVRHIHLTPTTREVRERMYARWSLWMPDRYTDGWQNDVPVYQGLEVVRSAYVDLDRLVTGSGLDAPNVRRAVGSYTTTLRKALAWLEMPAGAAGAANPYLALALPHADHDRK